MMRFFSSLILVLTAFAAGFYANEIRHAARSAMPGGVIARPQVSPMPAEPLESLGTADPATERATFSSRASQRSVSSVRPAEVSALTRATQWIAKGNYPEAAHVLEQLVDRDSHAVEALRLLARVYEEQGLHEQAIERWFQYLALETDAHKTEMGLQYLGHYLLRLAGNSVFFNEHALWLTQKINDLIRLTPDNGELHLRLAAIHWDEKDKELAQYHALMAANQVNTQVRAEALLVVINGRELDAAVKDAGVVIGLQRYGNQFLVPVTIEGMSANLLLDTGASISGLTSAFLTRHYSLVRNTRPITLNTASGPVDSYLFVVKELTLGSLEFTQHMLARLPMDTTSQFDGLLGVDILGRFEFFIDQENAELHLRKR